MPDTARKITPPAYRHYRPKNLGVVRIDGHDRYLGEYGSAESWERYHRLIADWLSGNGVPASERPKAPAASPDLTVNGLLNAYRQFAEAYYLRDGKPTKELADMKYAARPVRKLFGTFGRPAVSTVPANGCWQRSAADTEPICP